MPPLSAGGHLHPCGGQGKTPAPVPAAQDQHHLHRQPARQPQAVQKIPAPHAPCPGAAGPDGLRSGHLQRVRARQGGHHPARRPARLLLPHAHALSVGQLARLHAEHGAALPPGHAPAAAFPAAVGLPQRPAGGPLRGQFPPCGPAHPQILAPRGRRGPSAGGHERLHAPGRTGRGTLPLLRPSGLVQARGPGRGGLQPPRPSAGGGR